MGTRLKIHNGYMEKSIYTEHAASIKIFGIKVLLATFANIHFSLKVYVSVIARVY